MEWFGRLLFVIDRHSVQSRPQLTLSKRSQRNGSGPSSARGRTVAANVAKQAAAAKALRLKFGAGRKGLGGGGGGEEYGDEDDDDDEDEEDEDGQPRRGNAAAQASRARIQAEVQARRAALASADLRTEPGLAFWLAKQRWLWRQRRLGGEQALMLTLAGVDTDTYSPPEWQAAAHAAARFALGSTIALVATPAPALVAAPAAAAAAAAPRPSRMHMRRWVLTQQALYAEGRLSPAQLRYMTFLGERRGPRGREGWGSGA